MYSTLFFLQAAILNGVKDSCDSVRGTHQFADGYSTWSTTKKFATPSCFFSSRPSCSLMASRNVGPESSSGALLTPSLPEDAGSNSRTKSNVPFRPVWSKMARSRSPEPVNQSAMALIVMSRPPSLRRDLEIRTSVPSPQPEGQSPTIVSTVVPVFRSGIGTEHEDLRSCGFS